MVTMEDVKPFYTEEQKTKLTDELQVSLVEASTTTDVLLSSLHSTICLFFVVSISI